MPSVKHQKAAVEKMIFEVGGQALVTRWGELPHKTANTRRTSRDLTGNLGTALEPPGRSDRGCPTTLASLHLPQFRVPIS